MTTKLTREQISAMTADELRLAVAELMGWKKWHYLSGATPRGERRHCTNSMTNGYLESHGAWGWLDYGVTSISHLPNYPGDISFAISAADKFSETHKCNYSIIRQRGIGGNVEYRAAVFGGDLFYNSPYGETAYISEISIADALCRVLVIVANEQKE